MPDTQLDQTTATRLLAPLNSERVLFGHQSVGSDIVNGIRKIAEISGQNITIIESRDVPASGGGVYHFYVGKNGEPEGKLKDFAATIERQSQAQPDVALVKLCFADISANSDAVGLANDYLQTLQSLKAKYPSTRFVGITMPLMTVQSGPRAWVKKLLGRLPDHYLENAKRQEFNDVLRAAVPREELFDLATWESHVAGTETSFSLDGKTIQALNPRITSDGGHLTDAGKVYIAKNFLQFLGTHNTATTLSVARP